MDTKQHKTSYKMAYLLMATYFVSYISRINYGAVIAEMVNQTHMSKALLSMALTGSFITYGSGQIISGICGDKIQPKILIFCGLIVTAFMNLTIPFCTTPYQMTVVWCVNGFAQAFMWPPIVKLLIALYSGDEYPKASVIVSYGSTSGTILIYLIAPVIISLFNWKGVFVFSSVFAFIMALIIMKACCKVSISKKSQDGNLKLSKSLFSPVFICVLIAIILQGMLRDGVTTWMPSYISETYNLSSVISILTGVILPVFSIICFNLTSYLYRNIFKNPLKCAFVIYSFGAIAALIIYIISGKSAVVSIICSAIITGAMHGVNFILVCMLPAYYKGKGNVSTISGILNSCTYIGSALSTYGIAVLSEIIGWHYTVGLWFVIAFLGSVICVVCVKPWRKYIRNI